MKILDQSLYSDLHQSVMRFILRGDSRSCKRPTAIGNCFEDGSYFKWIHVFAQSLTR